MVSVELTGGLGNQMFQYAFALAEADGAELIAYHADVPGTTPRNFELGSFGIGHGAAPLDWNHEHVIAIGRDGYESVVVGCGEDVHIRGMWMGEGPWKE